jgi:hypothetical protein
VALQPRPGFCLPLRVSWYFFCTMWGYQLHDRPIIDTLIQPSETSSSNYQRLSRWSRETQVRNGRLILPTSTYRARMLWNIFFLISLNILFHDIPCNAFLAIFPTVIPINIIYEKETQRLVFRSLCLFSLVFL